MRDEAPGKLVAGALALLVHVAFLALLVLTVNWQSRAPQPMVAELWSSLPPPRKAAPRPEPKPEAVAEKAAPPKQEAEPIKPEIVLKDKKEEKRREEKRKLEEEKRKAEQEKLKQQALKEKQEKVAKVRQEQEQQAMLRDLQAREAATQGRQVNDFKARINAKIKRFINNQSCSALSEPKVEYDVTLMPTGQLLLDPKLVRSSGSPQCDQAIERAIRKAEPLPLPPDASLFSQFRELHLTFRPNEEQ